MVVADCTCRPLFMATITRLSSAVQSVCHRTVMLSSAKESDSAPDQGCASAASRARRDYAEMSRLNALFPVCYVAQWRNRACLPLEGWKTVEVPDRSQRVHACVHTRAERMRVRCMHATHLFRREQSRRAVEMLGLAQNKEPPRQSGWWCDVCPVGQRARWTVCVIDDSVCEVARWVSHGHAAGASQCVVLACQPVGVGTPCMQVAERGRGGAHVRRRRQTVCQER